LDAGTASAAGAGGSVDGGVTGLKRIVGAAGATAAGAGSNTTAGGAAGSGLTGSPVRSGSQPSRSCFASPDDADTTSAGAGAFEERAGPAPTPCPSVAASTLANAASSRSK